MCGIGGYYAFGETKPVIEEIKTLLLSLEDRGTDATGIGYFVPKENKVLSLKAKVKASEFIKIPELNRFKTFMPTCMIVHTRKKVHGDPKDNRNNHPIMVGSTIVVHNGVVDNFEELYQEHPEIEKTRRGKCDTEIVSALFDREGNAESAIKIIAKKCIGTGAFAVITSTRPDELILARSTNPIAIAIDEARDIMFFASTRRELISLMETKNYRGFSIEPSMSELKEDTAVVINNKGVSKSFPFPMKRFNYTKIPSYYNYQQNYKGTDLSLWITLPTGIMGSCGVCMAYSYVKIFKNKYTCLQCFNKENIVKTKGTGTVVRVSGYGTCEKCHQVVKNKKLSPYYNELLCKQCYIKKIREDDKVCSLCGSSTNNYFLVGEEILCQSCYNGMGG